MASEPIRSNGVLDAVEASPIITSSGHASGPFEPFELCEPFESGANLTLFLSRARFFVDSVVLAESTLVLFVFRSRFTADCFAKFQSFADDVVFSAESVFCAAASAVASLTAASVSARLDEFDRFKCRRTRVLLDSIWCSSLSM